MTTLRYCRLAGWMIAAMGCNLQATEKFGPDPESERPTQVYWGDTHVHTAYSSDSYLFGNTSLTPDQAYKFARGETVVASNGMQARLQRPLDFLVVADHAENLGMMHYIRAADPLLMKLPGIQRWFDALRSVEGQTGGFTKIFSELGNPQLQDAAARAKIWRDYVALADASNHPGVFTTLPGFEWSPTPNGNNLHRVVIFKDNAERVSRVLPYAAFDSEDPRDLWRYLATYQEQTGGDVLAIPHNGNGSNGLMYPVTGVDGKPLNLDYTTARRQWEPLIEVTQIKGDSETHPLLSPDDEFADFSTWDKGNLLVTAPKQRKMLPHEYARSALNLGLQLQDRTGVNPYQFGMLGSTDSHTSMATADDNNFWGGHPGNEPAADRMSKTLIPSTVKSAMDILVQEQAAAGYAAVWAQENTRSAIFEAMRRREVYASTGPRITLRFFGGWQFTAQDALAPDLAKGGYAKGVPMGSELTATADKKRAPAFIVAALKDPYGANLDRVQIIKGWLKADGTTREKVYDVSWAGARQQNADGKLPELGSTVDVANARYDNSIGAAQLNVTWQDPEFDPSLRAFYYVRVLEIPTPRWVVYDAQRFGIELPAKVQRVHQERAYSSPIWYVP